MDVSFEQAFSDLFSWCRDRDFAGHDPFDALNSRVFQLTPLRLSRNARLLWTQACKRSPVNFRGLALVPRQKNAKGLALFALAALANYRRLKTIEAETEARELLDELVNAPQCGIRRAPPGVTTSPGKVGILCAREAGRWLCPPLLLRARLSKRTGRLETKVTLILRRAVATSYSLLLSDPLNTDDEICFSYSPSDQTRIFNASLLAAETLASVGRLTERACSSVNWRSEPATTSCGNSARMVHGAMARQQDNNGSDNFHTAYVLSSLNRIAHECGQRNGQVDLALRRGYAFWRERFFLADGWPKYYHDSLYPADAHAAATAIITLLELRELDSEALSLAETIAGWTISNLRDAAGILLLPAPPLLYGSHAIHALDPGLDALCAGAFVGREVGQAFLPVPVVL